MLMTDAFGDEPSKDAVVMFEQFALVLGLKKYYSHLITFEILLIFCFDFM